MMDPPSPLTWGGGRLAIRLCISERQRHIDQDRERESQPDEQATRQTHRQTSGHTDRGEGQNGPLPRTLSPVRGRGMPRSLPPCPSERQRHRDQDRDRERERETDVRKKTIWQTDKQTYGHKGGCSPSPPPLTLLGRGGGGSALFLL